VKEVQPVLLIEDDPDIRILAEMTLRMSGIDVVACAEGVSGLKALENSEFSLIICDVMMPDMSGYEVLNRIRERYGEDAPPVALFTARPQQSIIKDLAGRDDVHILLKPFEPARLAQSVQELMRK
jgi:CheY-like chemotaxis protein